MPSLATVTPLKTITEVLPVVRLAVEADIPALIAMGKKLHRENGIMPFSETRARDMAIVAARGGGRLTAGVIGPVGAPEAVIVLTVGQYYYSDLPHLEELFVYVQPEFRASNRAKALLNFAKNSAKALGVPLLIGVLSNRRTKEKIRLYERQFGKPAGAYWLYNGKTGE